MNTMRRIVIAFAGAVLVPALIPLAIASAAEPTVVIEANALQPPVLEARVRERVTFVNRTGRPVHLEFRHAPERHEVFQIPGQIWATFFVPGRHPSVTHVLEGTKERAIEGAVEVKDDPARHEGPPVCDGTTLSTEGRAEVCIER